MSGKIDTSVESLKDRSDTLPPAIRRIRELTAPDPQFVKKYQCVVGEIAAKVASSVTDPEILAAIERLRWEYDAYLFRQGPVEAPDGFVTVDVDGLTALSLDPRYPYNNYKAQETLRAQFTEHGMDKIVEESAQPIDRPSVSDELHEIIKNTWQTSSIRDFFVSFDSPIEQFEDAPLDQYWQQVRSTQLESDIRRRHGVALVDPLLPGSLVHQELGRALYRLDDETSPLVRKQNDTRSGLQHLQAFLWESLKTVYNEKNGLLPDKPTVPLKEWTHSEDNPTYVIDLVKIDGTTEEFSEYEFELVQKVIDLVGTEDPRVNVMIHFYITDAIQKILCAKRGAIADIIQKEGKFEQDSYIHTEFIHTASLPAQYWDTFSTIAYDFTAPESMTQHNQWNLSRWNGEAYQLNGLFSHDAKMVDEKAQELDRSRILALVSHSDNTDFRLIVDGRRSDLPEPSTLPQTSDLELRGVLRAPHPLGYRLVAHDGEGNFAYERDGEPDAYAKCEVLLPKEKLAGLAEAYEAAGLDDLAAGMRYLTQLTVEDLVSLIKRSSDYIVPKYNFEYDEHKINSLSDLTKLTNKQTHKMEVQCTGAAQVVRVSLDYLFGQSSSNTVAGYVLDPHERSVHALQHMQTTFNHEGRTYILDATPHYEPKQAPISEWKGMAQVAFAPSMPALKPKVTAELSEELPEIEMPEVKEVVHDPIAERTAVVNQLIVSLTEQLKALHGVRSEDKLYEKLVLLHTHDVSRRTLEVLKRTQRHGVDLEDLDNALEYARKVKEASTAERKIVDAQKYDQHFIDRLVVTLENLRKLDWELPAAVSQVAE